ncbi:methyltransferase domain-containing protein [Flavobacterium sp. SM2513]|uniref:methyltransferase domain-containing protein n=1 Tax=Flavobacterium sp. SM2513 TaxID=3424766 RepID=UPI003D7F5C2C
MSEENCCVVTCDRPLDQTFWENQYQARATGWDLGEISPPLKTYIDKIQNKALAVLIPGCGNAYEAAYLLKQGFTNVTLIDIAPALVQSLHDRFTANPNITIILGDFFDHQGRYDLILEQTFFCALPPTMRQKYVWKMHQLLSANGILSGLLFNRTFEAGPPFGGDVKEYEALFQEVFVFNAIALSKNSILSRAGTELFFEFSKNASVHVDLYNFEGITCNGCKSTVTAKYLALDGVLHVSMNTNFSEVLIVSKEKLTVEALQKVVSYDENYKIKKH